MFLLAYLDIQSCSCVALIVEFGDLLLVWWVQPLLYAGHLDLWA